jgi:hypothetical protein
VIGRICGYGVVGLQISGTKIPGRADIEVKLLGAMLEEPVKEGDSSPPKMKGSAMLIGAKTKEEVLERVKKDVYVEGRVWDVEKVQIIPFRSALRKAL